MKIHQNRLGVKGNLKLTFAFVIFVKKVMIMVNMKTHTHGKNHKKFSGCASQQLLCRRKITKKITRTSCFLLSNDHEYIKPTHYSSSWYVRGQCRTPAD